MNNADTKSLSRSKRILFRSITISFPLLVLLIFELALRAFSYGGSMKLFVDHKIENYEEYYLVNPAVGLKYFSQFRATEATNDIFLKKKPENGFRIFVLGSSTMYGFPYERNLMATRILHKRLQDAYPQKYIELVNTSITAINSITLADFARQLVKYEPNAILIYAGHNEFYGAFGPGSRESTVQSSFFRSLHLRLIDLRVYQLMQNVIRKTGSKKANEETDGKGTLMKRIVADGEIDINSKKYEKGILQFEKNLGKILEYAEKNETPVFLSDLVSNIRDVEPFGDVDRGEQSSRFNYEAGIEALVSGDTTIARTFLQMAKDLDPVRFRASEDINSIIYDFTADQKARLVETRKAFEEASPGGIIGNDLLTEHVHPNIEGQFLLADVFFKSLSKSGLIDEEEHSRTAWHYRQTWPYTPLDSLIGAFRVRQIKSYWPFTSLDKEIHFRDEYEPKDSLEGFAFQVITDPDASGEKMHHVLGTYYEKEGHLQKALEEYEALVYINPYWPDYLNIAANAHFRLNDLYAAEKLLRESLKYGESYFSLSMLAEIEFIKHRYEESLILYERARGHVVNEQLNRESELFLYKRLYYLYHINGLNEDMNENGKRLHELGYTEKVPLQKHDFEYSNYIPENIQSTYSRALSFSNSNIDSSLYYLEKCLDINDCPLINLHMGDILYQKQDLTALGYYLKAYEAYSMDPNYLARLFYAYFVNVKKEEAGKTLLRLKQLDPDYSEIPRLEMLLSVLE